MKTVSVHEAKTQLSRLIQEALQGEEIVISRGKTPVVRLVPLESALPPRTLGKLAHLGYWMEEDFDAPLEDFREYMS